MSVCLSPNSKIYIACPANIATGGPELLNQLGFNLRKVLGVEVYMYYYNFNPRRFNTPVHSDYQEYNLPYVIREVEIEDRDKNVLIVSEVLGALQLLPKFFNIRKGIWFLSVDNYYFSKIRLSDFFIQRQRIINKIARVLFKTQVIDIYSEDNLKYLSKKYDFRKDYLLKLADFYMTNSHRGLNWFKELKPLYYLSEYLNSHFLNNSFDMSIKEDCVAYNPKKGFPFTSKIIKQAIKMKKQIKFIPLINMSRKQVIENLEKCKVYIDFGNHPGKDRIPREAAILGCCVITNKRGSAAYFEDVPIPDEYKFDNQDKNIPQIIEMIRDCFTHYEDRYKDFDYYRSIIRKEPEEFVKDLSKIFVRVND